MISAIGSMVGAYILVRMLRYAQATKAEPAVVRFAAIMTMFITVLVMVYLWVGPAPTVPSR